MPLPAAKDTTYRKVSITASRARYMLTPSHEKNVVSERRRAARSREQALFPRLGGRMINFEDP